jgi:hypothetical protein
MTSTALSHCKQPVDSRPDTLARFAPQVPLPWPAEWRTYKEQSCGLVNLGVSCFLNAAVQVLVPVWFNTYGDNAAPTTRLGQLLVHQLEHAVLGVAVSGEHCTDLLRSLPAGFGWSVTSTGKVSHAMKDATECFDMLLNELRSAGCGCIKYVQFRQVGCERH